MSRDHGDGVRAGAPTADLDAGAGDARRVLVVDDTIEVAELLGRLVEQLGHSVRIAYTGEEALRIGAEQRPELVLLDLSLPDLDGYEVARRIRTEPWGVHVRLVAVTGWGDPADGRPDLEAGFDRTVPKPVRLETLRSLVESLGGEGA